MFPSAAWIAEFRKRADADAEPAAAGVENAFTFLRDAGEQEFLARADAGASSSTSDSMGQVLNSICGGS